MGYSRLCAQSGQWRLWCGVAQAPLPPPSPATTPENSVYGLFPFFTPAAVKENLTNLKLDLSNYNFERPKIKPIPIVINTISAIRYVFSDYNIYKQTYTDDMNLLTQGYGYVPLDRRLCLVVTILYRFMLSFDEKEKHSVDRAMVSGLGVAPIIFSHRHCRL